MSLPVIVARESTGAQNDELTYERVLTKGTWTLNAIHVRDSDAGIFTVYLVDLEAGQTLLGTIDSYAATRTYNVPGEIAGFTVDREAKWGLRFVMATKNASSSAYYGRIQFLQVYRTGD